MDIKGFGKELQPTEEDQKRHKKRLRKHKSAAKEKKTVKVIVANG